MNNQRRRFRPRQQKNNFRRRNGSVGSNNSNYFHNNSITNNHFINRNGSTNNPFNVEKTIQKYQQLAKDALSSGDPILSENYFQHAEHFSRRLSEINVKSKDSTPPKEDKKELKSENS